jgi:NIPSNAP
MMDIIRNLLALTAAGAADHSGEKEHSSRIHMNKLKLIVLATALTAAVWTVAQSQSGYPSPSPARPVTLAPDSRCFELRTYYAAPGKLGALSEQFRLHTDKLFAKHGMTPIGYWIPSNRGMVVENKLVYMLAYPNREARDKSWAAFANDPEWKEAVKITETNGPLVSKVEVMFLSATDYSPLK